jgi:hypothetical protein
LLEYLELIDQSFAIGLFAMYVGGGAAPGYGGQSYGGQAGKFILLIVTMTTRSNFNAGNEPQTCHLHLYQLNLNSGYGQGYGGGGASYSAPSGGAYGQKPGYSQSMGTNENFGAASAQVR